ncbi:signal peptidase I [Haloferax sp. YSMS24]|uniref:signal peptidase I n=1 Tax=Haloferax sp. YSMS24 TaxID=3388425 RepID=UPI00398C87C6
MTVTEAIRYGTKAAFGILILSLVVGQAVSQPVGFSYVETGSMAPTMDPGDGFVAVPIQISGSIQQGDVVVYEAEELHGGSLTTHRVVGETERGLITKGDANPFTDQDGREPPVKRAQIVATALQVNGHVVVIPHLGTSVEGIRSILGALQRNITAVLGTSSVLGTQGLAYLFFSVTLLWYFGRERYSNTRERAHRGSRDDGIDAHLIVGVLTVLLLLGATVAMTAPSHTQKYGIVSAEFESDSAMVIPMSTSKDVTYPVRNGGLVPVVAYLEPASEGVEIRPHETYVRGREMVNATVTLHAPPQTGYYRRYLTEHRYLAILPAPVLHSLYTVHPWLPIVVIDALIAIPFYLFGIALLGTGRIRERSKNRTLPLTTRIRRLLRAR